MRFLNSKLVPNLGFEKMLTKNRVFDPSEAIDFPAMSFAMWPGYYHNLIQRKCGTLMNIKSLHQVIRTENLLEKLLIIRELSVDQNLDYQEEIRKMFKGVKVVTKYNNKTYLVEDIDFDINTESTFQINHGDEGFQVSFYDYFTKRYREEITQKKQPMILAKTDHGSDNVHLVPELCYLVGMTDQMRNRRFVWREIKQILKVDGPIKIQAMENLLHKVVKNAKNIALMTNWQVSLSMKPKKHRGYKLNGGNIIMGQQSEFAISHIKGQQFSNSDERIVHNIDSSGNDLGIKLQNHKLFDQVQLEKWGVFY